MNTFKDMVEFKLWLRIVKFGHCAFSRWLASYSHVASLVHIVIVEYANCSVNA